jgi:hypothetical protein
MTDSGPTNTSTATPPYSAAGTVGRQDIKRLGDSLNEVERIAVSTLARLDEERASGESGPEAKPVNEAIADLLNHLFDAYDALAAGGIEPVYDEWYDVRERMRTP